MLFGQSLFQSVVQRLEDEAATAAPKETEPVFRIRSLGAGFVSETVLTTAVEPEARSPYDEILADLPPPAEPVEEAPVGPPMHLLRVAPEEIAADLGLKTGDTLLALAERRRAFARLNHPDAVAPQFRDLAHIRMTFANHLIDKAIRDLA